MEAGQGLGLAAVAGLEEVFGTGGLLLLEAGLEAGNKNLVGEWEGPEEEIEWSLEVKVGCSVEELESWEGEKQLAGMQA